MMLGSDANTSYVAQHQQPATTWQTSRAIKLLTEHTRSRSHRISKAGHYAFNAVKTGKPSVIFGFIRQAMRYASGKASNMKPYSQPDLVKEAIALLSCETGNTSSDEARYISLNRIKSILAEEEYVSLIDTIHASRAAGRRVVCVLAPIFTEERIRDGYYRRIQAIDSIMGEETLKIYLSPMDYDYGQSKPMISYVDKTHINIAYDYEDYVQQQVTMQIVQAAGVAYHHSVGFANAFITRNPLIMKIYDLHGALPEEHIMRRDFWKAQMDGEKEEQAMHHATAIVCVTDSMQQHMAQKYPDIPQKYIVLPILDQYIIARKAKIEERAYPHGKPIITYAGGTQEWQMIDTMQDAISQMRDNCEFRIFVPSPASFWETWGKQKKPSHMRVQSKSLDELLDEYAICHYGFVLREDSVVNSVACPTKLIEYMLQGIVPIMKSTKLGDFVAEGMQYISLSQFCANELPSEEERVCIARENQEVITKLIDKHECGKQQLLSLLEGNADD